MGFLVLIAFIAVPLIEIGLFIEVGGAIGLWPTILVVVLTAMAGTALLRHQGLGALARLQNALERGEAPLEPVFDGFCLLAAGALLLTPGFFTDAVGFALFVPAVRAALRRLVARHVRLRTHVHFEEAGFPGGPASRSPHDIRPDAPETVIDGEYEDVTDHHAPPDPARLPNDGEQKRD